MHPNRAVLIFLAFAFAYFLSTLIRAITATLSPTLVTELGLNSRELGLLAGAYFLGFASTQLPLGTWLDRHGPKRVEVTFLGVAVLGCALFSVASSFAGLWFARMLCGVGVSACLMAPLTGYRRWYAPENQLRANSWMLMVGASGMVASTLPVQWLLPVLGWRPLFQGLAVLLALAALLLMWAVPAWQSSIRPTSPEDQTPTGSYAEVWRHPYFRKLAPLGFFCYGGMVAMQTLWAAPWMVKVAGYRPAEAATGLFWINVAMLLSYLVWGWANPWLSRRGYGADKLLQFGVPLSLLLIAIIVVSADAVGAYSAVLWTLFCVSCTVGGMAQAAVGMAFRPAMAGRALSAYNLVIFLGVFCVQWGIGLIVDGLRSAGLGELAAFQGAVAAYAVCSFAAYAYFLMAKRS